MKNAVKIFMVVILALMVMMPAEFIASAATYGDFEYTVSKNEVRIDSYKGSQTDVTIPSSIQGFPVTSIKINAFQYNNTIKKVVIPDGVTKIDSYAFASCYELCDVCLPDGLLKINDHAFYNCKALKHIELPDGLTYLGTSAFADSGLIEITIPGSLSAICSSAFQSCKKLEKVTFNPGLEKIYNKCFYECTSLKNIVLPSTLKIIEREAFVCSSGMPYIVIPQSVTEIDESAAGYKRSYVFVNYDDPFVKPIDGFCIYGYPGSAAQVYAENNGFEFKDVSSLFENKDIDVSLRISNPGMRFRFNLNKTDLDFNNVYEMELGFLYCIGNKADKLSLDNAGRNGVIKKKASNYLEHGNYISYNLVFTNIPKSAYDSDISVRGYAVINGIIYYTDPVTKNLNQVAQGILNDESVDKKTKTNIIKAFKL